MLFVLESWGLLRVSLNPTATNRHAHWAGGQERERWIDGETQRYEVKDLLKLLALVSGIRLLFFPHLVFFSCTLSLMLLCLQFGLDD